MTRTPDRRSILKGAGAALLPFVPLFDRESRAASAPGTQKRLIFVYSSNGTVPEKWLPSMVGGQLVLSEILKPLEAHKSDLLAVDGLAYKGGWNGHELGMVLTGSAPQKSEGNNNWATGISIDQAVANGIGSDTKFKSLECGVQVEMFSAWVSALSYRAPLQPLRPENSPQKIFDRAFTGLIPPSGADNEARLQNHLLDRKSVVDFVTSDLTSLRARLGTEEKKKMDAHLENIRDIERTLSNTKLSGTCKTPMTPQGLDATANDNIPKVGRLQMDLLLMALACDLTRVGTIQFGRGGANHRLSWLGPDLGNNSDVKGDGTSGIHGLAHNEGNAAARAKLVRCHTWYAGEVAYLVDRLKMIPEGNGTMADNTLVVWVNELANGSHGLNNVPFVLVGKVGGRLRTNQVARFPGESHARLLLNIAQTMGLNSSSFGTYGNAPLPGLAV